MISAEIVDDIAGDCNIMKFHWIYEYAMPNMRSPTERIAIHIVIHIDIVIRTAIRGSWTADKLQCAIELNPLEYR